MAIGSATSMTETLSVVVELGGHLPVVVDEPHHDQPGRHHPQPRRVALDVP